MILITKDGHFTEIDDSDSVVVKLKKNRKQKICLDNVKTEALTWADIQFLKQAQAWEKVTGRSMKIPARIKRCINS